MAKYPDAHIPTEEEVRDVIADREHKFHRAQRDELYPVGKWDLVEGLLGKDPSWGNYRGGGFGPSRESYVNPHLSMSALTKVLDNLVGAGVLTKVNKPTWRQKDEASQRLEGAVRFYSNTAGWVLTESYEEALAKYDARKRDQQRRKLRKAAEKQIVEKYARQVTTVYRELCAGAGLDPDIEQPDKPEPDDQEF